MALLSITWLRPYASSIRNKVQPLAPLLRVRSTYGAFRFPADRRIKSTYRLPPPPLDIVGTCDEAPRTLSSHHPLFTYAPHAKEPRHQNDICDLAGSLLLYKPIPLSHSPKGTPGRVRSPPHCATLRASKKRSHSSCGSSPHKRAPKPLRWGSPVCIPPSPQAARLSYGTSGNCQLIATGLWNLLKGVERHSDDRSELTHCRHIYDQ